ncbi:hypothetical protein [Streptococcus gordonii]|uniref:hypothetical protein n=1 Tax=Streptococcus gordonii TaxID=1302 RepID=UPI000DA2DA6B|nr:hypothetical protein [Streptococcus gordonii]SQG04659.1 Uncharacterised protein [Streptococcus gordonii]
MIREVKWKKSFVHYIASVAVIIGSVLPWGTVNLGGFGGLSVSGIEGDGKIIIILAIGAIVLAILKDRTQPLIKNLALGVIETAISIYALFRLGDMSANFGYGGYGISVGIGLYLTAIASIATFVLGLMAFSGGKISKETLTDAANVSKEFPQTVGRVTSATVKTAVNDIKKETDQPKDTETPAVAEESKKVEADENKEEPTKLVT